MSFCVLRLFSVSGVWWDNGAGYSCPILGFHKPPRRMRVFTPFSGCVVHLALTAWHLPKMDFTRLQTRRFKAEPSNFVKRETPSEGACFLWRRRCGVHRTLARGIEDNSGAFTRKIHIIERRGLSMPKLVC